MTMFTRNEKSPETTATPVKPVETHPASVPTATATTSAAPLEPKRTVSAPSPSYGVATGPASVISKALKITGQLESTEDIQIDGEIDGDVRGVNVKVGSNAKVKGTVYGESVELSGTVDGKIEAKKVVLTSTAHMSGDVVHQDIRIESGAFIDGHCRPEYGKQDNRAPRAVARPVREGANGESRPVVS